MTELHDAHVITRSMYFGYRPHLCFNYAEHTLSPDGYSDWQDWANAKSKTHKQQRCAGCGLYSIWVPRGADDPIPEEDFAEYDVSI